MYRIENVTVENALMVSRSPEFHNKPQLSNDWQKGDEHKGALSGVVDGN
ncbi:Uncharacterized protein APZ42_024232 [Daphnia magna]|uniref:Uncharacterized protein n=1 Tax=Daphnia magna TaxID=35525 RepID=A0A164UKI8_9CRUS|nr:Uncharacterized protein APZ42_024232 [Daphnia magna]